MEQPPSFTPEHVDPQETHLPGIWRYPEEHRFVVEYPDTMAETEKREFVTELMQRTYCVLSLPLHRQDTFGLTLKCAYVCRQNIAAIETLIRQSGARLVNAITEEPVEAEAVACLQETVRL